MRGPPHRDVDSRRGGRRQHDAGQPPPGDVQVGPWGGGDCVGPGFNVTSCVVLKLLEESAAGPVEYPMFSRGIALRLKDFAVDLNLLANYLKALEEELQRLYPLVLRITIVTESPLAVHLRNPYMPLEIGLAWHPVFNAPYIPATALKGALRAGWPSSICGMSPAELFGFEKQEGALVVTDAFPTTARSLEPDVLTPHYKEPNVREDRVKPTPLVFPVVKPGSTFDFFVASRRLEKGCMAELIKAVNNALSIGLGAKTSVGYGVVRLK